MNFERSEGSILLPQKADFNGRFHAQLVRKGQVIDEWSDTNLVVNEGLNSILSVMFDTGTQLTNWFLGLFQGNYTPVATDTASVIAVNSTECSSYTSATRPAWSNAAPSSQSISNSGSPATFTFNAAQTIYGAFLISDSTIAGTAGTLFAAARFGASKAVVNLDQLLLTYTFSASSS
jgi:hypothetical protein